MPEQAAATQEIEDLAGMSGHDWYHDALKTTFFGRDGEEKKMDGTVRSRNCMRQNVTNGHFQGSTCRNCKKLGQDKSLRRTMRRQSTQNHANDKLSTTSHAGLVQLCQDQEKNRRNHNRAMEMLEEKLKDSRASDPVKAISNDDARGIVEKLILVDKSGLFEGAGNGRFGTALSVMANATSNMATHTCSTKDTKHHRRNYKHHIHPTAMMMYEVIHMDAGPRVAQFVASNLLGPTHRSTVLQNLNKLPMYSSGVEGSARIIDSLVQLYTDAMLKAGLRPGSVPVQISEDETNTLDEVTYNSKTDCLENLCGRRGDCECNKPATCNKNHHRCHDNFTYKVGNKNGYQRILDAFGKCMRGSFARVMMVNPLHRDLPKIPILIMVTCNRFTHKLVQFQWEQIARLYDEKLASVIGPLLGNASDGDARRRKLMHRAMTGKGERKYEPENCPGFEFSGTFGETGDMPNEICDQDWRHNSKKFLNSCDVPSRTLMIGPHMVTLQHCARVRMLFSIDQHGTYLRDSTRSDRQNWDTVLRLCRNKNLACLESMNDSGAETCKGTLAYFKMMRRYIHMFYSRKLTLMDRVRDAAYLIHFLSRWRMWVLKSRKLRVSVHCMTTEAYQDLQLSCHTVILVIMFFRDYRRWTPVSFQDFGSDCCEMFFSTMGSWYDNKRNYTGPTMMENSRKVIRKEAIKVNPHGPKFGKFNKNSRTCWGQEDDPDEPDADLADYDSVTDDAIAEAWADSDRDAKSDLCALGCTVDTQSHTGDLGWCNHLSCPILNQGIDSLCKSATGEMEADLVGLNDGSELHFKTPTAMTTREVCKMMVWEHDEYTAVCKSSCTSFIRAVAENRRLQFEKHTEIPVPEDCTEDSVDTNDQLMLVGKIILHKGGWEKGLYSDSRGRPLANIPQWPDINQADDSSDSSDSDDDQSSAETTAVVDEEAESEDEDEDEDGGCRRQLDHLARATDWHYCEMPNGRYIHKATLIKLIYHNLGDLFDDNATTISNDRLTRVLNGNRSSTRGAREVAVGEDTEEDHMATGTDIAFDIGDEGEFKFGRVVRMVNSGEGGKVIWRDPVKLNSTNATLMLDVLVFDFYSNDGSNNLTCTGGMMEVEFSKVQRIAKLTQAEGGGILSWKADTETRKFMRKRRQEMGTQARRRRRRK